MENEFAGAKSSLDESADLVAEEDHGGEYVDLDERNEEQPPMAEATISRNVDPFADPVSEYEAIEALDENFDLNDLDAEEATHEEQAHEIFDEETPQTGKTQAINSDSKKRRCDKMVIDLDPAEFNSQANFAFSGTFYKLKILGETSGCQVASEIVTGDTVDELLRAVWDIANPFLYREVIFVDGSEGKHLV
ncbi:uncharacterized protein LOC129724030 [Wyeomyia smithii]|uniref:uncharacterized protein LOC129724030 n=1 Tax=Wyeomyia smithii TaxID=174621 RepID=UPI002467BFC2|nr:uncharacterized protein LOC129724030 [Wyeomyia smithii]